MQKFRQTQEKSKNDLKFDLSRLINMLSALLLQVGYLQKEEQIPEKLNT